MLPVSGLQLILGIHVRLYLGPGISCFLRVNMADVKESRQRMTAGILKNDL